MMMKFLKLTYSGNQHPTAFPNEGHIKSLVRNVDHLDPHSSDNIVNNHLKRKLTGQT